MKLKDKAGRFRALGLPAFTLLFLATLLLNACSSASTSTSEARSNSGGTLSATATLSLQPTPLPKEVSSPVALTTSLPSLTTAATVPVVAPPSLPPAIPTVTTKAAATPNPAISTSVSGCGQAAPIKPGTSGDQIIAAHPAGARGSTTRSYRLHLPARYKLDQPQAVLLVFHGHGGSAADMESGTGFSALADTQGFIAVYPQGIKDDDGLPMWASVGPAADYGIDDLAFTNDLLNQLQKELCVNTNRVYATGFSNGGGMSHYLACRLAGRIAAVAPIAGNYFALPDGGCQPSRAVALLEIHGTADPITLYNGRPDKDYPGWPMPAISDYLAGWASRDGCSEGPQTFLDTSEVKGQEWTNCRDNTTVAHYQIKGGGHSYPDTLGGRPGNEVIWSFLNSYTLHP